MKKFLYKDAIPGCYIRAVNNVSSSIEVIVENVNSTVLAILANYSGIKQQTVHLDVVIATIDKDWQLVGELMEELRDAGCAFAGAAYGWSPSDVVDWLREQGLFSGSYREVIQYGGIWAFYER